MFDGRDDQHFELEYWIESGASQDARLAFQAFNKLFLMKLLCFEIASAHLKPFLKR